MALDDDQRNWNKENIPLNEDNAACWQVSQNVMQEIRQEVTRQVLAELTINNSDESDESDGKEDTERQQNSGICQSSFPSQHSDYFCDFQNNEASTNEPSQEKTRIINRHELCFDNASSEESEESFCSSEDWMFSEKISLQSVQPKWKSLQRSRRPKYSNIDLFENKERKAVNDDNDSEKKSCEGLEEFITPPLCTIPGIELEYKMDECSSRILSKIISPKASTSSGLSREMEIQNEHRLGQS
ncbi:hypothetical protein LOAG_17436 [Loa loa]|uniref:Uncharacterized protein n=1 Tax=Loa loa TaxID=7209 RepID=A0A1S0UIY5_LOALO|nr:hypothetical protein LOAG_17436 [Loa loa]EJD75411.1 hypothetical protein LOAG_17436 [Loa loa]